MSDEILGYDCQGEALRAGDRVVLIGGNDVVHQDSVGEEEVIAGLPTDEDKWTVLRAGYDPRGMVRFEDGTGMYCEFLRRINSGRDVFEQARDRALSEGNPDAQHEWIEPTTSKWVQAVLSGMPWTETGR